MLRSALIAIDLEPGSARTLERCALLPLAPNARLTLVHVVPKRLSPRATTTALRDAKRMLDEHAEHLASLVPKGSTIDQVVRVGGAAAEIAKLAATTKAELIVTGRRGGRPLRDAFLGATAERVVRHAKRPVLMIRRAPRKAYRRPALALDIDSAGQNAIAWLLRLIPAPRPTVDVVHAYTIPFEGMVYPGLSREAAREGRAEHRQHAQRELTKLMTNALARAKVAPGDAPRWRLSVQRGDPSTVIKGMVSNATPDLLVLGTRGYASAAHAFIGSVAGDVLREVACDVLVVPPE